MGEVPTQTFDPGPGKIGVVLASNVFECANHHRFVYVDGKIEPYQGVGRYRARSGLGGREGAEVKGNRGATVASGRFRV